MVNYTDQWTLKTAYSKLIHWKKKKKNLSKTINAELDCMPCLGFSVEDI